MSPAAVAVVVRHWGAAALCVLALAACADNPAPSSLEESAVDQTESPTPDPAPGADSPVAIAAVEDLAGSLGVDPDRVEVVAVEDVTWSDGSRGCARPGMMYTQALIDGSRITLRVDGTTYEYHAGGSHPPALCETPTQ